jgi:hypothetical protein
MTTRYNNVPVKLSKVTLEKQPGDRTREDFVQKLCAPAFAATTFGQMMECMDAAIKSMAGLGLYKTVDLNIKHTDNPLCPGTAYFLLQFTLTPTTPSLLT